RRGRTAPPSPFPGRARSRTGAITDSPGHRGGKHPGTVRGAGRDESTARLRAALAELPEPEKAAPRRPPERNAALFFGPLFTPVTAWTAAPGPPPPWCTRRWRRC
ncbi:hypothetical protein ABT326_12840, partial [Streptomyces sp. NPDC000931]